MGFLTEFWQFLRVRKKYWLLPVMLLMVAFGSLLIVAEGSAIGPAIYTLF